MMQPQKPSKDEPPCGHHSAAGYLFLTIPGHEVCILPSVTPFLLKLILLLQLFVILLILSWLQAADKLNNPFGQDKGYDTNLDEVLDTSLWRSSKILQQEYLASSGKNLQFLDY